MASTTVGVAPPSSPKVLVVGCGDAQQSNMTTSGNKDSPMDTKLAPINPLLLASACFGSSGAMSFLFNREDSNAPPMVMPTQPFLDLLDTPDTSIKRRLMAQHASDDIEDVVDQPTLPAAARLLKGVTIDGDTALHVLACHGDNKEFLKCASIMYERDQDLLLAVNKKGDTPLHIAARAGKSKMVSYLTELAGNCNTLPELLRKENCLKETALHDAVRTGNEDIVELLLMADHELGNYPKEGTSPLYLAISLEKNDIARTLHDMSNGNLSYYGPHRQNALHAAILQGTRITEHMLKWNNNLSSQGDKDGSTPLHFASSFHRSNGFKQLLEANPATVYHADNNGLFPIHVAAAVGAKDTIKIILKRFPSSARLLTARGQTFLHVAIEKGRMNIAFFVCRAPSLAWILNMRDNDGNTALHLAVQTGRLRIVGSLYANKGVHLNLANNNKKTALDISRSLLPRGMYFKWSSDSLIYSTLKAVGAKHSCLRQDQTEEKYTRQLKPEDVVIEAGKMKESSQMLGIGSVLIATVAFSATFAVPGGFIADDHTNRGTPTLAGRYAFDAFMMANALAFICSLTATIGLIFSGSPMVNLMSRQFNLGSSSFFMASSVTCLSAAFALGVYMVLAPVAHATAIVICVLSPLVVLYTNFEFLLKVCILARPIWLRMGTIRALNWLASMIVGRMIMELWPFILIFGWAAIARKLRNHL